MVYEDDLGICGILSILLQKEGYLVSIGREVNDAICEKIIDYAPDLIIMDLKLPKIGGEAAVKMIKNNPQTSKIPLLIFSSVYEAKAIAKTYNAEGFVPKPSDTSILIDEINSLIGATK